MILLPALNVQHIFQSLWEDIYTFVELPYKVTGIVVTAVARSGCECQVVTFGKRQKRPDPAPLGSASERCVGELLYLTSSVEPEPVSESESVFVSKLSLNPFLFLFVAACITVCTRLHFRPTSRFLTTTFFVV